jgi:hypothetical protein
VSNLPLYLRVFKIFTIRQIFFTFINVIIFHLVLVRAALCWVSLISLLLFITMSAYLAITYHDGLFISSGRSKLSFYSVCNEVTSLWREGERTIEDATVVGCNAQFSL